MMDKFSRPSSVPLCFDGIERDLALTVIAVQKSLVSLKGYNPQLSEKENDEIMQKATVAISSSFSTFYGCEPSGRYKDVFAQVADFASKFALDHIFPDANKRTTVVTSLAFLLYAGFDLDIPDMDDPEDNEVYRWIQDVVTREKTIDELAAFLRDNSTPAR